MNAEVETAEVVRAFEEFAERQYFSAGGKGSVLAHLYQAGYPIPDGFVILHLAFSGDEILPAAWKQVQDYLKRLRSKNPLTAFAVRSSAVGEDSLLASFAGEFETVLNVRTDEEVHSAITKVHRSRNSPRVKTYGEMRELWDNPEIAVIVLSLLPAEISGVLFTADPVTGNRAHMAGNFVSGLGDKLVSGEVEPDEFKLSRPRFHYEGPSLMKAHAKRLFKLAIRIERDFKDPQDIE